MDVVEAFERGKETRKKQDDIIALFIQNVRNIEDMGVLRNIEKELKGNA
jgi:hypothetical protein